jgi:nucleotide-binding universal stress UspA family protein
MSGIICAIRGGPESLAPIDRAIDLAGETGLPLVFLYVVNLDFLSHAISSHVHTITQEMHQMGEFILLTAQSTAGARGVTAQGVVRQGNVAEEIIRVGQEMAATYVVLGRPKYQEASQFTRELFHKFVERVEEQTGAAVVLPQEEDPCEGTCASGN